MMKLGKTIANVRNCVVKQFHEIYTFFIVEACQSNREILLLSETRHCKNIFILEINNFQLNQIMGLYRQYIQMNV